MQILRSQMVHRRLGPRIFARSAENSQQYQLNYDSASGKTPNLKQESQNSGESSLVFVWHCFSQTFSHSLF